MATVMLSAWLTVTAGDSESVTVTVKLEVPVAVGVPVMESDEPVFVPRVKPAGKLPLVMLQVYGPMPPVEFTFVE